MNLKELSDRELIDNTKSAVIREKTSTFEVLHHLREIETRRLHLSKGYPSLFTFCLKELGYDEYETQKRIAAMRLLREIPQIENKIASGELSLTALNKAKTVFNKMAKKDQSFKTQDKIEVLKTLENKSIRECEKELIKLCPEALPKKLEGQKLLTENLTELKVVLDQKTLDKLSKLKSLFSNQNPNMTMAELIDRLADQALTKIDSENMVTSKNKNIKSVLKSPAPKQVVLRTRYIPAKMRRQVWQRDEARCTFTDPDTKRRCNTIFQLEIDHLKPFAMGGENTVENLRILCQPHNTHEAIKAYGLKKMSKFIDISRLS